MPEVFLAATATVRRRRQHGAELTSAIPLINCAQYGDASRNSDPAIGAAVNRGRAGTLLGKSRSPTLSAFTWTRSMAAA